MSERPSTSKSRGVCQYFRSSGGCRNGDMCKFLHGPGETLTPYDKGKTCKFFAAGFCKRGDKCWFRHVTPTNAEPDPEDVLSPRNETGTELEREEDDVVCSICQEKPITYGLLESCSHVFCLECIRGWREPSGKSQDIVESGNTKKCPYCRTSSKFVTPSSVFYPDGNPLKATTIACYKASMSRIPCKYFGKSRPGTRFCPFGKDCFYQHKEADGSTFVFDHGADYYMTESRHRRRNHFAVPFVTTTLGNVRVRWRSTDEMARFVARLRSSLNQQSLTSLHSAHDDTEVESESNRSDFNGLLSDMLTQLRAAIESPTLSYASSEDEREEEGRAVQSRPSILATPDESTTTSALPLTRAFMDRNMLSDVTDSLTDVLESESGGDDRDEETSTPGALHQFQFRRYSLPNLTDGLAWPDGIDARDNIAQTTLRSDADGRSDIDHPTLEESLSLHAEISQESDEPEVPDSFTTGEVPVPQRSSNESSAEEENSMGQSPATPTDGLAAEGETRPQDRESRNKPEARNELAPRRTKSSNSTTSCGGRRNGGQSFVTDGRGRVVATDDCAYTDGASLAFWHSPTSIVAPQTESTGGANEPATAGLGALDDLD